MSTAEVIEQALSLKASDRYLLLVLLHTSLDKPDFEIDRVWQEEALRRVNAYDEGLLDSSFNGGSIQGFIVQLIFLTLARDELAETMCFYNRLQQGLGESFKREAESAARLIQQRPFAWQIEIEPVRRFILGRFPYKMLYIIRAERIV